MTRFAAHRATVLLALALAGCQTLPPPADTRTTPAPSTPVSRDAPAGNPAPPVPPATRTTPQGSTPAAPASTEPFRNIYRIEKDTAPAEKRAVDYMAIPDAIPRAEPRGKYGNKSPYTVNGRSYRVLESARGYKAEGMASWYGEKFHGHRTSSFEPYDMYAMTAAHTTLPIPSYVRVTNLGNGRSVVVRVNDRGPFHRERIIDLSWAAAQKLGYAGVGTARVRVETVEAEEPVVIAVAEAPPAATPPPEVTLPDKPARADEVAEVPGTAGSSTSPAAPAATPPDTSPPEPLVATHGYFVQLGAFAFPDAARALAERARAAAGEPVSVFAGDDMLHRVGVGPYEDRASAERIRDLLLVANLGTPALVFVPPAKP